ncbi:MAG: TonB-dependent receptor, partial [Candidatus Cloacimonetes bacterium]|nr:TonB-dependent receptor [Candidatus Cloacimonadota bacterium]
MKKIGLIVILTVLLILPLYAQVGKIAGRVTIENSGQPLANAAIILVGAEQGAYTKDNGTFTLTDVPVGSIEVQFRYMGYGTQTLEVEVIENETAIVNVKLVVESIGIEGIKIVSDRAKERQTPVAFTDIDKEEMQAQLGSRDIPLALVTTPSVYATDQGGGAGDARVNVRGFDQRNVAIMINGVPVNDMENGWVYWSNWDGVGDATSSIQMQRGLSAVNLATPSIGGTMNIITDPTAMRAGVDFKQEFGSGGFLKSTLSAGSGLINNKFAVSAVGVRKTGDGIVDKAWTDAWAYYLSTGWNINANNKLEFYVVGAPQRHGQNLYKQNIAVYDAEYAEDLDDYDPLALDEFDEGGREYNQNWGNVSADYEGKQWWNDDEHDRFDEEFINERENFYHKPQVNLNWYTKLNEDFNVYSILYYSGGKGGGTGTYGSIEWDYSTPTRTADWDATIAVNDTASAGSEGILRNSRNNQWTIGAISKAYYTINENLQTSFGIDWRTAEIEHYREVRDLLGGEYYYYDGNDFDTAADYEKVLGDKIAYNNTNTVD